VRVEPRCIVPFCVQVIPDAMSGLPEHASASSEPTRAVVA
jgi:hypothetical protein